MKNLSRVDLVTDDVDGAHAMGEVGQFQFGGVVGVQFLNARNHLADTLRRLADSLDALLAERVHFRLKPRDQVHLQGVEGYRRPAEDGVLGKQEHQNGDQRTALEGGQGQYVAHITAQGLDLGRDHGDDFALGGSAEVGPGKAKGAAE